MTAKATVGRARRLRRALTPAEARLWTVLRREQLGVKFRRQHPLGPFILDFYCAEQRPAVEVDGEVHGNDEQGEHDRRRSAWLAMQGVRVIRCTNEEVRDQIEGVVAWIRAELIP